MSTRGAALQRRIVSPSKVLLVDCDSLDGVSAVGAAGNLDLDTDHRGGGANSIEWDKLGTATLGGVALDLDEIINLADYSTHSQVMIFARIPTPVGGTIVRAYIALGTDAANLFYWEIPLTDIVYDAFAHYHLLMSEVDGVEGVGADLSKVKHIGFYIETNIAAVTLTDVLIDEIVVKRTFEVVLVPIGGEPFLADIIDRADRQVGKVQLTDFINDGEVHPDGSIPIAPAKVTLAAFDDLANVAAVGSAAVVGLNVDHRGQGAFSTDWNKVAGAVLGGVAYTPPAAIDISKYSTHAKVMAFMYIPTPDVGNVANLYVALGTDAANLFYWSIPLADIVYDAWHHYHLIMSEVSGVFGNGADLSNIQHVSVYVQTALAADTLTGILVDDVIVKRVFDQMINQEDGSVIYTEDTGVHTNPELWLHDNHWQCDEVTINAVGVGGEQTLGPVVPAGVTRRIRSINIRNVGITNTVVTLLISGGANQESWDLLPQQNIKLGDQDGWEFDPAEQPAVQASAAAVGSEVYVAVRGVEA